MASKWREYFVADTPDDGLWVADSDLKLWAMLDDCNQENTPRIKVVSKAALDEALELIGELEAVVESIAAEKCKPNFDDVLPNLERGKLISIIDVDTDIARKALAKIKAFKDKMNESTTTDKEELK